MIFICKKNGMYSDTFDQYLFASKELISKIGQNEGILVIHVLAKCIFRKTNSKERMF